MLNTGRDLQASQGEPAFLGNTNTKDESMNGTAAGGQPRWTRGVAVALVMAAGLAGPAWAQNEATAADGTASAAAPAAAVSDLDLLRDFIHFVRIARYDVAAGVATELQTRISSPQAFVRLVESSQELQRFEDAVGRGMRVAELEPAASALSKLYESGKLAIARDPEEIARNIQLLVGQTRGRILATQRLVSAGEYAVPQLLTALLDRRSVELRAQAQRVLTELGPQAVMPLSMALLGAEPAAQERIADVLGAIPYPASLPFLAETRLKSAVPEVKTAAERAINRISGAANARTVSELYLQLAERYYAQSADVTSFPGEDFQLVWDFRPATGLAMTAVRTAVYHEAMTMRLAERTLRAEETNAPALALWVAANLRRELQTPEGYDNPLYPATRRDAMYFAVAAGSGIDQRVLARALDARDTLLARRAIAALDQTAGARALVTSGLERQPLLEALAYPNRRVQYEAALALGRSQPAASFAGAERVVPTLAGTVREATAKYAVVIATDAEKYTAVRGILERDGFAVLPRGRDVGELAGPIGEVPGVDLVVIVDPQAEAFPAGVSAVRGTPKLTATPVLGLTQSDIYPALRRRYETATNVGVRPIAASESEVAAAVKQLVDEASGGPITADEATAYAQRALAVLRDLAVQNNQVLNVADAGASLIRALGETQGAMKLAVAEVLARIDSPASQIALMDAALAATGSDRLELLTKVTDSGKRYGNRLETRQVNRVLELARSSDPAEATLGAALAGALSLPNQELIPLVLDEEAQQARR